MNKFFKALLVSVSLFNLHLGIAREELISPPLKELLKITAVSSADSIEEIVSETQKKWLRAPGSERWHLAVFPEEKKEEILEQAKKLGFVDEVCPKKKAYDYCLLLGATFGKMEERLNYIKKIWDEGVRFHTLVFLTGKRPLEYSIEPSDKNCVNESEAIRVIWKEAELPIDLKSLPCEFVEVEMKGAKRPTTADTLIAWLQRSPKEGSCFFISSQPYCKYQHATAQVCLPSLFEIETVGPAAPLSEQHPLNLLDSIARWLYSSAAIP